MKINLPQFMDEARDAGISDIKFSICENGDILGDITEDERVRVQAVVDVHVPDDDYMTDTINKHTIMVKLTELDNVLSREGEEIIQVLQDANIPLTAMWEKRLETKELKEQLRAQLAAL